MKDNEDAVIRAKIPDLLMEHRDLDAAITARHERGFLDQIQLRRLKKRKLLIKDRIVKLQSQLIPHLGA